MTHRSGEPGGFGHQDRAACVGQRVDIAHLTHRSGEPGGFVRPAPMRNADAPWFRRWGQPASSPSSRSRHACEPLLALATPGALGTLPSLIRPNHGVNDLGARLSLYQSLADHGTSWGLPDAMPQHSDRCEIPHCGRRRSGPGDCRSLCCEQTGALVQ